MNIERRYFFILVFLGVCIPSYIFQDENLSRPRKSFKSLLFTYGLWIGLIRILDSA